MSAKNIGGHDLKLRYAMAALAAASLPAAADPIEFRYGFDVYSDRSTILDGMNSVSALVEIAPNLSFGPALYSAILGDAGGLFIGGFELLKRVPLNDKTRLEFGGFLGGGGGAGLIPGDGLMSRAYVGVERQVGKGFAANLGVSYTRITGSPVASTALSFGITRQVDFGYSLGPDIDRPTSGRVLRAFKPYVKQFRPQGSLQRSGTPLQTMTLVGAEASFAASPSARNETFIQMSGAVAGDGEGYADFQLGYRWLTKADGFRAFAEVAGGFAGGGDVDTGGGLIASVGAGIAFPISKRLEIETGAQATQALNGDFTALSPYLRVGLRFGRDVERDGAYGDIRRWQQTVSLSYQSPNAGFRKAGDTRTAAPVLIETALDLFLTDRTYALFSAQTVASGDAGGYAVGLLGLGYAQPLGQSRWTVSGEVHIGAAGGGGVDTGGGLVGGGRVELDYRVTDTVSLSAGVGTQRSLRGGGAQPTTFHLGFKAKFNTYH